MCYIYKFWWNSVSKYIGLYLAITSYSTRFNISHSLLSHDHYISRTFAINWQVAYIVSDMYKNEPLVPWKQDEPHIYTRWWLCLYLWLYASEINYRTSKRTFFFCERSLPEKETFWFADERRSIKDCSLKHLQPKEKGKCVSRSFKEKKHLYIL